jgi:prophage regulatory protein
MPERILRLPEVLKRTGMGRNTIYRATREGKFPQAVELLGGRVGWLESEVDAWITKRKRRAQRAPADKGTP